MDRIALIIGHTYIYWSDMIRAAAVLSAVSLFLALFLRREGRSLSVLIGLPLAAGLSLLLSRLAHWYFRPEVYQSLEAALSRYRPGDFALMGVFAGCVLTALILRLTGLTKDLPDLLDCMSLAAGLGIALGRLSSFFDATDRGRTVLVDYGLPWVLPVTNPVSGVLELRLATFLLQSLATGMVFLILLVFYLTGKGKKGDTSLLFLLFYGASQVLLDSSRYDAITLRSNGFIHVVQLLGAGAMAVAVICIAACLVRAGGWKKWYAALWGGQAVCFGLAGFMEYYVQRHGAKALFAYSVMGAALAGVLLLALVSRCVAAVEERKHTAWLCQIAVEGTAECFAADAGC